MMSNHRVSRRAALALPLLAVSRPAGAVPPNLRPARTRIIRGAVQGGEFWAGVEIALDAGWKTYWRLAGDSGIPPRFDFSGSLNLAAAEVLYPAPERLSDGFGEILGYLHEVVFPIRLRAAAPGAPVTLGVALDYGVCERLCLPMRAEMRADLPASAGPAPDLAKLSRAFARVPRAVAAGEVVRALDFDRATGRLSLRAAMPRLRHVVVEAVGGERPLPLPRLEPAGEGELRASLTIEPPAPTGLLVTAVAENGAVEERWSLDG